MKPNHISHVVRIRRQVRKFNFEDETMRLLGSNGSLESIRAQAELILSQQLEQNNDSGTDASERALTREEQKARVIINAIDALARIDEIFKDGVISSTRRLPSELEGMRPLNRATLEGGRDTI